MFILNDLLEYYTATFQFMINDGLKCVLSNPGVRVSTLMFLFCSVCTVHGSEQVCVARVRVFETLH